MSEAIKLRYLLSKTKHSLQYGIRKEHPTTITQFLQYARREEELLELSSTNFDMIKIDLETHRDIRPQLNLSSQANRYTSWNQPYDRYLPNRPSRNFPNSNSDIRFPSNYNQNTNNKDRTFSNRQTTNNVIANNNATPPTYRKPFHNNLGNPSARPYVANRSNPQNNQSNLSHVVNVIDTEDQSVRLDKPSEQFTEVLCDQCQQFGHETSVCPNF